MVLGDLSLHYNSLSTPWSTEEDLSDPYLKSLNNILYGNNAAGKVKTEFIKKVDSVIWIDNPISKDIRKNPVKNDKIIISLFSSLLLGIRSMTLE
jgi:hypothetical protein